MRVYPWLPEGADTLLGVKSCNTLDYMCRLILRAVLPQQPKEHKQLVLCPRRAPTGSVSAAQSKASHDRAEEFNLLFLTALQYLLKEDL